MLTAPGKSQGAGGHCREMLKTCWEEWAEIGPAAFPLSSHPTEFPPADATGGRVVQRQLVRRCAVWWNEDAALDPPEA